MPKKYKGPSNKEVFAGFQAMQGAPMTAQEADQDNQNSAIRSSPEFARGFQEGSRVSPGYEPKKNFNLKEIKRPAQGGARPPKKQKMVAKINTRKAYDS